MSTRVDISIHPSGHIYSLEWTLLGYSAIRADKVAGRPRFCYIDGIWNKESVDEWLTEIQLPIKR